MFRYLVIGFILVGLTAGVSGFYAVYDKTQSNVISIDKHDFETLSHVDASSLKNEQSFDLELTAEMMEEILPVDKVNLKQENHESRLLNLRNKKDNGAADVSGGVFFDETEPGYIPVINGGKINIDIPFDG